MQLLIEFPLMFHDRGAIIITETISNRDWAGMALKVTKHDFRM